MTTRFKAHTAILTANLIFAINYSVMKYVTVHLMSPLALNVLRVTGSMLLFWLFALVNKVPLRVEKKHRSRLIICALTGIVINQVLFNKGISLTTPIHGALLMLVCPIAVVFIAALLIGEGIHTKKIVGLLLGVSGAVLLVLLRENAPGSGNILAGDLLIMSNALSYAFYLVLVQPLMKQYDGITVLTWMFTFSSIVLAPAGWNDCTKIVWHQLLVNDWIAILFIIIAVTFLGYLLSIYSVQRLGPSITGAYIYTQPFFAGIIAFFYAGDTQHLWTKLCAGILIMTGVYLVSQKRKAVME
jgi:drug/metabolite transporter (DMT)-like permease